MKPSREVTPKKSVVRSLRLPNLPTETNGYRRTGQGTRKVPGWKVDRVLETGSGTSVVPTPLSRPTHIHSPTDPGPMFTFSVNKGTEYEITRQGPRRLDHKEV